MGRAAGRRWSLVALLALLSSAAAVPAGAAPGDLDRSFGRRGKVTTDLTPRDDQVRGMVLQPNGKIVVAGSAGFRRFALARYRKGGRLDRSFGDGGTVITRFGAGLTVAYGVALQQDGKIVAAGIADHGNAFAVARYQRDGALDSSFGGDGRVTTAITGDHDLAFAVAIQPDGKIVLAGTANFTRFALARYEPDGSLDPSFGEGGIVLTDITFGDDIAFAVAIQPDGKILAAGRGAGRRGRLALARYAEDGSLDPSFGRGGKVLTNLTPRPDAAHDLAIQPNGRILAVGAAGARRSRFAMVRYARDGSLDGSFGDGGKVRTRFTRGPDIAFGVALQPDRRIVVAGHAGGTRSARRDHRFVVARYRPNGGPDRSFGNRGRRLVAFTTGDDWAADVAVQPDGSIVAAGRSNRGRGSFALARLEG